MSKAILIVDIDDKYSNAIYELRANVIINCYGEEIEYFRNQCLKPLPAKMNADYDTITSAEVTEKVVAMGFNFCIDTILGEKE